MDAEGSAELGATWARHLETQERRIAAQERAMVGLMAGALDDADRELAATEAHKLAGSLGSFGLTEGSELASELESTWIAGHVTAADMAPLAQTIASLRRLLKEHRPAQVDVAHRTPANVAEQVDVLLVDDDDSFADFVVDTLQPRYQVTWLADGASALFAIAGPAASVKPRLILLDIEMPGLDGLSVLEDLAQQGITRECAVVMLTRRTLKEKIVKARKLGAFDFLAKPLTREILVERVSRALEAAAPLHPAPRTAG
jgi:two-component system, OmpR family, response regulator